MLAAFLTTILFSCSAISARRLSNYVSGTQANLVRLMIAGCLLGAWVGLFAFGINRAMLPLLFVSGCVGFGVGDLAMFQAYPRIGTRRTMVIVQCLAAPFAAVAEWIWLNQAPTLLQAAFGILILIGVGIALMPGKAEAQPTHGLAAGICFGVVAALGQAGGVVLSRGAYAVARQAGRELHGFADGLTVAFIRILGGIVVSGLFFAYLKLAHKPLAARPPNWRAAWPWLVGTALAGPTLGVSCIQWALMTTPTNIVMPIVATTPLAVMPLARFFEGERFTRRAVIGGMIAVGGVIGLTLSK